MSYTNIHSGDYGWVARLTVTQDDTAVDISSYTTRSIVFVSPAGVATTKTATFVTTGTNGQIQYTVETGLINTVGMWCVYAVIAKTGVSLRSDDICFLVI